MEAFKILKKVSSVSRKIDDERLSILAEFLVKRYQFSTPYIEEQAIKYAESSAPKYRDLQLFDFTNPDNLNEAQLKEEKREINKKMKEYEDKMKALDKFVEKKVEERLNEIFVDLKIIGEKYAGVRVPASQAAYVAIKLLEEEKKKKIDALVEEMKKRLEAAYQEVIAKI